MVIIINQWIISVKKEQKRIVNYILDKIISVNDVLIDIIYKVENVLHMMLFHSVKFITLLWEMSVLNVIIRLFISFNKINVNW